MIIKKILTLCAIASIVFMAACKKDVFEEEIVVCPEVESTNPADQATNVPITQIITIEFNKELDSNTINTNSIIIEGVNGTVSYSGFTATFEPSAPLAEDTTYIGKVKTTVKDVQGNALQEDYVWTFSTSAMIIPVVVNVDPLDSATGVALNKTVIATFNMPMNPTTINGNTFTLTESGTPIAGAVNYSGNQASFKPTVDLNSNTEYEATITTGAQNTSGVGIANDYVWVFTTGTVIAPTVIETDPKDKDIDVTLDKIITAKFSEPMDPTTINGTSFLLTDGTTSVNGVITYADSTASFDPAVLLDPNTLYTATIKNTAENVAGIAMANDYVWTFTTEDIIPPTVVLTDPKNNDIDVPITQIITAEFSEAMDPTTIDGLSFLLMDGTTPVNGLVTYNGLTATFTPSSDLNTNTQYSATITNDVKNVAGTNMLNDYNWIFTTEFIPIVDLKSVARFGIISGVAVSNNAGPSQINNLDVGIYPGVRSSITGFFLVDGGPGMINNGNFYASDDAAPIPAMLLQAKNDLTSAYLAAEGASSPAPATVSGDIGGQTLAPGIYKSTSTLSIQNGNLTLDGQGDPNAEWIFQIASDFTTFGGGPFPSSVGGNVILIGGANADNVTWQVGSSATIGDYTSFNGNILALTSVTMNAFSQATGRMLCSNGSVTLTSTNVINKP